MRLIFGAPFAQGASALRVLSTTFVLTYLAIIYSTALVMLERAWTLTLISVAGLVLNACLNFVMVRYSVALGEGGGATGCALAFWSTELVVMIAMAFFVGRRAFDRRNITVVAKSLLVCAMVIAAHPLLKSLGPLRLAIDGLLYLVLAVMVGALRPNEMFATAREALRSKSGLLGGGSAEHA
jgi:O-antigen/teichoic acid export membrane protein